MRLTGQFGHAWVYLQGVLNGCYVAYEGGHSGELGRKEPTYFDGVMNYIEYGYSRPAEARGKPRRKELNPIKYLWSTLQDGFYQQGNGGHTPTYAAKVDITPSQFTEILKYMSDYNYSRYNLKDHQCTTFVAKIAALIGLMLPCEVTVPINQRVKIGQWEYSLWNDSKYAALTVQSPDILERSLNELVQQGQASDVLCWYRLSQSYRVN